MAPKKKKVKSVQERRAARLLPEMKQKARQDEIEAEEVDLEELVEEEPDEAAESLKKQLEEIEKDYGEAMPSISGPTSFDELESADKERERIHEVNEMGWKAQQLVYNIINHPTLETAKRAEAIKKVGDDFGTRVSEILAAPAEELEKDLDLLSVETILAHDKRHSNIVEQWLDKAKVVYASRQDMPDGNFALVVEKNGEKVRKYLIHDKAHVRNALARAAQQIEAGGEGAADAKAAMPKIRAAAKKFGIEVSMKKERNAIVVEKDAKGDWRWVGWVSNNFIDRSEDIITEAAHLEYTDWVNKDLPNRAPVFTSCHAPGTSRENPVDFVGYENGFLVMSGKLNEMEAQSLMKVSKETDIGMSHTSWGIRGLPDVRQIVKYRCFEVTDLPVDCADNPFTTLETLSKEVDMDQLDYLSALLGSKEKAERALKLKTSFAQKELENAGVESKEAKPVEPAAETQTPPAENANEIVIKEIMDRIKTELDIPGLNAFVTQAQEAMEKVPLLESVIKELSSTEDDRLAEKIAPPAQTLAWSLKNNRASEKDETIVKEGEKVGEAPTPGDNWLSEATGTKPIVV